MRTSDVGVITNLGAWPAARSVKTPNGVRIPCFGRREWSFGGIVKGLRKHALYYASRSISRGFLPHKYYSVQSLPVLYARKAVVKFNSREMDSPLPRYTFSFQSGDYLHFKQASITAIMYYYIILWGLK